MKNPFGNFEKQLAEMGIDVDSLKDMSARFDAILEEIECLPIDLDFKEEEEVINSLSSRLFSDHQSIPIRMLTTKVNRIWNTWYILNRIKENAERIYESEALNGVAEMN